MKVKYFVLFLLIFLGCKNGEEVLPKPKAELRLEYPKANYIDTNLGFFSFERNQEANFRIESKKGITIGYPNMNGSIYITYKNVDGNLDKLLSDAQKLSYEHVAKADNIAEQPFVNEKDKVYGMYYEVFGDAASQAQFYVTDSTEHFVTGSLYFFAKPNYDSIQPAAAYLQEDIKHIMETFRWNE
ncbi:gliding motility lipoprotein GldD [Costertonia aggregata]|uniref:Gliding motility lipoprotein GldD n=1 Tax=Costertonia aggregata TaxID=343403 RepID=A0A7H9AQU7_9FLAO|nr:gliding motility lipoprotein GldD [Costertonia aggregata]QLG45615.1 gliding motility lipoprotein GldD [Costertonia aggregata]